MNRKRTFLFTSFLFSMVAVISAATLLNGCKEHAASQRYTLTGDTLVDGKNLVQINCTKCHSLVPVNALTKDVWKFHVLPDMGPYLGMTPYLNGYFKKDTSGLSLLEWKNITSYYQKAAPDSLLPAKPPVAPVNDMAGFAVKTPKEQHEIAYTTMVAVNPYNHKIYTSDAVSSTLTEWNSNLSEGRTLTLPSTAVDASFEKNEDGSIKGVFSCIGQLEPMDFPNGKVVTLDISDQRLKPAVFASELFRPVQAIPLDFNKDDLEDWLVCAPGKYKGGVYVFKQNYGHTVSQVNVSDKAGAVKAVTGDFNKDGWPDVMVLYGRGDEGLTMFLNDQHGSFKKKELLKFPPVYGSTDFELTDLDNDGNPDLILSCGYNYNDSRILKPYHGLYIYKNTGDWNFKQQWFYPINGCTKFVTADFNGDGKLDIVTSAFFADLKGHPGEGCIYFEQDKPFSFTPHELPVGKYGRWMTMDTGDVNNDGKPDIILGNYAAGFNFQIGLKQNWNKKLPFIVLENHFKK
ncbi:MAG TPA: VCBS repeat-containing protein [Mucilaginibacter sp.]|nr:VCBS repeat-containing protein [Mucilaginibacter sp.]